MPDYYNVYIKYLRFIPHVHSIHSKTEERAYDTGDLLHSIQVQCSIQVIQALHPFRRFQIVRNHVLSKDPLNK